MGRRKAMNNKIANDLIRYAELVEDGALISPEEMNCASVMRLAAEALAQPAVTESHKQSTTCGEPVAWVHWLHGPVRLFLNKDEAMMELDRLNREYPVDKDARQMKPLYTHPPVPTAQPKE